MDEWKKGGTAQEVHEMFLKKFNRSGKPIKVRSKIYDEITKLIEHIQANTLFTIIN